MTDHDARLNSQTDRAATSHERRAGQQWDASYQDEAPPWDIGRPQPAVVRLCEQRAFTGPVLDAGCGTGENALEIAARGIEVSGVDVAPTAIRRARDKAASLGIAATFIVRNALQLQQLGQTFASVLDCGLFHTFDDDERPAYVEALAAVTAPGSILYLLCFSDLAPGDWGPRRIRQSELRASFSTSWTVVSIEQEHFATNLDASDIPAWLARIERV